MSEKDVVEQVAKILKDDSRETEQKIKRAYHNISKANPSEKLSGDDLYYAIANRVAPN